MPNTTASAEMLKYFSRLSDTERQSVLDLLKTFTKSRNENFESQNLSDYNEELEFSDAEKAAGDYVTHEEVLKRFSTQ